MCKAEIYYNKPKSNTFHHRHFGILCGKQCFDEAERKYSRMILGKDTL